MIYDFVFTCKPICILSCLSIFSMVNNSLIGFWNLNSLVTQFLSLPCCLPSFLLSFHSLPPSRLLRHSICPLPDVLFNCYNTMFRHSSVFTTLQSHTNTGWLVSQRQRTNSESIFVPCLPNYFLTSCSFKFLSFLLFPILLHRVRR